MDTKDETVSLELSDHARRIRTTILRMIYESGDGHVGCALSVVEILLALYFRVMNIGPELLQDEARDRFILSKGHAVAVLYATLIERGIAPMEIADQYCRNGSVVGSHASRNAAPGIEVGTGSGGHGLPIGVGMALAARRAGKGARVFVLCGDGELAEGSMWEAIGVAGHHALGDLKLIVDANGFQSEGRTEDIIDLRPMEAKFRAFRWDSDLVDGHDVERMSTLLSANRDKPYALIAQTTKGKGVSFMEGKYDWHHISPTKEQYEQALQELGGAQ